MIQVKQTGAAPRTVVLHCTELTITRPRSGKEQCTKGGVTRVERQNTCKVERKDRSLQVAYEVTMEVKGKETESRCPRVRGKLVES